MRIFAFKDVSNTDSSSGGAFPAIIDAVSKRYGCLPVVYGAAFDESFNVKHIRTNTYEDYKKLRGSKYVRSELGDSFKSVIDDLNKGYIVIFSGTPCQIAGLKKRVDTNKVNTANLFLVDIVCHGTPKPIVWNDFKQWIMQKQNSAICDFSFRYKKSRWKSYPIMARFDNGKTLVNTFPLRRYTQLFYSDLTLSEGCYKCPFATVERQSDITIGDFWGIRRVLPDYEFKEEVSQILISSAKGEIIFEDLSKNENYLIEEANVEVSAKFQDSFNSPTKKPENYYQFQKDYDNLDFQNLLVKYAEYNIKGFIKHCIKRGMGETGLLNIFKNIIKR